MSPELHEALVKEADKRDRSLNKTINLILERALFETEGETDASLGSTS